MMATQEQIEAARRTIERLQHEHADDVRKLIALLESGAMKGKAADKLIKDCQAWEAAYKRVFRDREIFYGSIGILARAATGLAV
ncbi:hypothetical protein ITP53_47725 [Nonomuraea sp. K274]|uniref:Uncharacterized protein n=1 Tax=Nonomuraea cypriaca TaxID=1187855 RepID=A0A931F6K1_9ACTN|nr:hypothetical protein [Nonomuraea cypriaca]MBF8193236.1 hypothetical protein [Nonomuraea cypriaca]